MGKDLKGKELGIGLTQRKDGKYSAKYTTSLGKRKEKYFDKITEARKWLNEERYNAEHGLNVNADITVDQWYHIWIENYKKDIVAYSTEKNYRTRYEKNIKPVIGHMNLTDVKKINCQMILNKMYDRGYSMGSMQLTSITLHAIFDSAVEDKYIYANPATKLKIKKKEKAEARVLTREEQLELLEYSSASMYDAAYRLVLETGMRVGEIGGLKWEDVDYSNRTISIRRTLLQHKEKGGFYFGTPKSKTSIRIIPLTDEAIDILKKQRIFQLKLKMKSKSWCTIRDFDGLVFSTINGNPVGGSTLNDMLQGVIRSINLNRKLMAQSENKKYNEFKRITMHTLRHTFATRCVENGMNPKVLQSILGHSTISVTMDTYVHVTDSELHNEIKKLCTHISVS